MQKFKCELFNVRLDTEKYALVEKWWKDRNWEVPHSSFLSTIGIMIYKDNEPICAGWLYQTDSLMAIVGFIIANTTTMGKTKKDAIKLLLIKIEETAKNLGFASISMPTSSNSIAKLGVNLGYRGDKINELHKLL